MLVALNCENKRFGCPRQRPGDVGQPRLEVVDGGGRVLLGRQRECATLDRLVEAVGAGQGRALLMVGEAGAGKTALLRYVAAHAAECRVLRTAGIQAEMELPFAGLHQLCVPLLDRLDRLPVPQRQALGTAFGLTAGVAPDRLLVGLAVLGLLAEAGAERPLLCLVDDLQWLDHASAHALAIAARRLFADSVGMVFATRERAPGAVLVGLTELSVSGLPAGDARALLRTALPGLVDERVVDQIVIETGGNPLALLELPRSMSPSALAGGFGLLASRVLPGGIELGFRQRVTRLPEPSRWLLLVAAADPLGDAVLVWDAAERLGVGADAAGPAVSAGLVEFGARVWFRHPLVRSAVYDGATDKQRQRAHRVLAECTNPASDPDRRAWHRARAVTGPDEEVAAELERSASRAQARGGLPAAAAFLARAVELTRDPTRRADRALAAAWAAFDAGAPEMALGLLSMAQAGHLDDQRHAMVNLLRAEVAFAVSRGAEAPMLLLKTAQQLESFDARLARDTYLQALSAARFALHLAVGGNVVEVAEAARRAPAQPGPATPADLLLDGLAARDTGELAAGSHLLKRAMRAFCDAADAGVDELRWLWLAGTTAPDLWDYQSWERLATHHVEQARAAGALATLPLAVTSRVAVHVVLGELAEAAALVGEIDVLAEAIGVGLAPYGSVMLAAWQGREEQTSALIAATRGEVLARGEGAGAQIYAWAEALLGNSLGRYADAVTATDLVGREQLLVGAGLWMMAERVEATMRNGQPRAAAEAFQRLSSHTRVSGTEWALGIEARCRALVTEGSVAEDNYLESIERLGRTRVRGELARAHLLYGEWLRRDRRRQAAREQLRTAHDLFTQMGMGAFARRAERELLPGAELPRRPAVEGGSELTAQEVQIAWLVREGLSNAEIGTRLFLSPRTVEWHLGKVFGKLGITSRKQLRTLPRPPYPGYLSGLTRVTPGSADGRPGPL
jgi:DNA-binding CsgD family transcriptional regulator